MMKPVAALTAAANAAGSIAAVNLSLQNHDERLAALLCTIGFLTAVAGALANHLYRRRAENPGLELRYYWTHVDFSGERNAQREAMLEDQLRRATRYILVAPAMVAISALLLVAGVSLIAFR
jgi:hypothetical protein